MSEKETAKKFTIEDAGQAFMDIFSYCNACIHKNVCKKAEERRKPNEFCQDFLGNNDHTRYSAIDEMFQPIFKWMSFHHPHRDTIFLVDNSSARMYLEHGAFAHEKPKLTEIIAKPLKHGYWIERDGRQICSVCNKIVSKSETEEETQVYLYSHCPFCGAIMDGKGDKQ